jgi:hypothetical protein
VRFTDRIVLATLAVALSIGVVGAAGLTQLMVDRTVEAQVVADNQDAAVRFECLDNSSAGGPNYSAVCNQPANGVVTLQLHKRINSAGTIGFNNAAYFKIGDSTANKRVLKITNNSPIGIKVWLEDSGNRIKMYNQSGSQVSSSATAQAIASGTSHEFYFEVDTRNNPVGSVPQTLTATPGLSQSLRDPRRDAGLH